VQSNGNNKVLQFIPFLKYLSGLQVEVGFRLRVPRQKLQVYRTPNAHFRLWKGKVAHEPRRLTRPGLILVSVAWSNWKYCCSAPDGILVHRRVTPLSMTPVPIYTPGWRETMWGKVSCPRKQHDGRDWVSNHRPSDLKSKALTIAPLRPHRGLKGRVILHPITDCRVLLPLVL